MTFKWNTFEHWRGESLYGEVQCIIGKDHTGTSCEQIDRQTCTTENITDGW